MIGQAHYWQTQYTSGHRSWDIDRPDFNLTKIVTQHPIAPCKALEIGCGTGNNSIWLAQQNFLVTATDIAKTALQEARQKAAKANIDCNFVTANFLKQRINGAPFAFVFDRGCFHVFDSPQERRNFTENVAAHLNPGGLWLTIAGNADDNVQRPGPPRRSASDLINAVEPYFEILSLYQSHFETQLPQLPKAWICLMQKRTNPMLDR